MVVRRIRVEHAVPVEHRQDLGDGNGPFGERSRSARERSCRLIDQTDELPRQQPLTLRADPLPHAGRKMLVVVLVQRRQPIALDALAANPGTHVGMPRHRGEIGEATAVQVGGQRLQQAIRARLPQSLPENPPRREPGLFQATDHVGDQLLVQHPHHNLISPIASRVGRDRFDYGLRLVRRAGNDTNVVRGQVDPRVLPGVGNQAPVIVEPVRQ